MYKIWMLISGMLVFLLVCAFAAAAQPDVSGNWDLKVEAARGTATPTVILKQQGEKLSGVYKGRLGESRLEGTIKGNDIQFSVNLKFQDQDISVRYTGKVEGETMSGTVHFPNSTGKWSARRKTFTK